MMMGGHLVHVMPMLGVMPRRRFRGHGERADEGEENGQCENLHR
jgi:hypothetical protein